MKEKILEFLKNVNEEGLPENHFGAHPFYTKDSLEFTADPLSTRRHLEFIGRLPSTPSRDVKDSIMGVGFETMDRDTFDPSAVIPLLGKTGVKYARCQTGWIKCELQKGVYTFDWLDDIADGLIENGIEPWFSVSFGNPLYTPSKVYAKAWAEHEKKEDIPGWARGYVSEVPMYYGEEAMQGFLNYARELAKHFRGRVHVYEIWNEPDWFWCCDTKLMIKELGIEQVARDYVEMVRRVGEVIREVDPTAKIASVTAGSIINYTQELGRAGLGNYIDIHSFHYYEVEPEDRILERIAFIRHNLEVPGRKLEIWQGESGRPSGNSLLVTIQTQFNQAKFLVRRFFTDAGAGLPLSSIFTASDFKNYYANGTDQQYGLITVRDVKPKLAYYAMQGCGTILDGLKPDPGLFCELGCVCQQQNMADVNNYRTKSVCFRRNGVPVFAIWQTGHVDLPHQAEEGELALLYEKEDKMENPIVIDPIRRNVYLVNKDYILPDDGMARNHRMIISDFPVGDYPYIITDLSFFENFVK